jgi:hypothetical protein
MKELRPFWVTKYSDPLGDHSAVIATVLEPCVAKLFPVYEKLIDGAKTGGGFKQNENFNFLNSIFGKKFKIKFNKNLILF